ncbi:MAG: hypothetical protein JNJ54_15330 [Myxococcaceae bacterium]|nr:hypothetical protein [Myxococcaceae bacterium]
MKQVLAAVVLLLGGGALACKCATDSPFLTNAMSGPVVLVKVTAPGEQRVKVQVEQQLAGANLAGVVTVEGADGGNCNASVAGLKKGDRLVLALSQKQGGRLDLSGCGVHALTVEGDVAKGAVDEGVTSMRLDALAKKVVEAQRAYEQFKAR